MFAPAVYGVHFRNVTPPLLTVVDVEESFLGRLRALQLVGETTGASPVSAHPVISRPVTEGDYWSGVTPYLVSGIGTNAGFGSSGRYSYGVTPTMVTTSQGQFPQIRTGTTIKVSWPQQSAPIIGDYGLAVYATCTDYRWSVNIHYEVL